MLIYNDTIVSKWVAEIKNQTVGMCEESFVIPMIILFYNDVATVSVLELKRKMRLELDAIEKRTQVLANLPWYHFVKRLKGHIQAWQGRVAVRIGVWRHELLENDVKQSLERPEFEFLKYLYKLTERIAGWRVFPNKHLPYDQLPKEFVDIKGLSDAPKATYDHLYSIQETMDAYIPAELQRTMCAVMLSKFINNPQNMTPADSEYDIHLLRTLL
jgi:hypothetical protein